MASQVNNPSNSSAIDLGNTQPIPPANAVGPAVRALNTILSQLSGQDALDAFQQGDSTANIDLSLWSPAWEGARVFRDHWLLTLARNTRQEFRKDINEIVENQPQFNQASLISQRLNARLRITLDFAFTFLTPRHVCFLGDALMLAFEADIPAAEFSQELAASASRSPKSTQPLLEALVLGASGMHRFQPERVLLSKKGKQ